MSERCSLADELRDQTEDEGEEVAIVGEEDTAWAPASQLPPTHTASGVLSGEGESETVSDIEVVVLDNDPLVQYLQDKQQPQPSHTVSAPARPAGLVDLDGHSSDEPWSGSKRTNGLPDWAVVYCRQARHTLLSVLCPCVLATLSPVEPPFAELDHADAELRRFNQQCLQPFPYAASTPLVQRPRHTTVGWPRLSVWLHGFCLTLALLACLITVGRAILDTSHSLLTLTSYTLLAALCACNWTIAQVSEICAHTLWTIIIYHWRLIHRPVRML